MKRKTEITYANVDYARLARRRQDELLSHTGRLNGVYIEVEVDGYPKLSTRGQRRRLLKGRHRGFVSPIPFDKAIIQRYTGEVDEAGPRLKAPLGIWRKIPIQLARQYMSPIYGSGEAMRMIRATHGVGRPVIARLR